MKLEKYERKYDNTQKKEMNESILSRKEQEMLEGLIDSFGLGYIVGELSDIAMEKSLHISENWQDEKLAREWEKDANTLERVAEKMLIN